MIARTLRALGEDGLLRGCVRVSMGVVMLVAMMAASRRGPVTVMPVALVFALTLGGLAGWHQLVLALFWPDCALWDAAPGWSVARRLALTACRLGAAWLIWSALTVALCPHGGVVALAPVVASALQRLYRAARAARRPAAQPRTHRRAR